MKLHELTPNQFTRVQSLFSKQTAHHLFCAGVLAGKYPGKVIVDNPEHPRSALLYKPGVWCYLGGDATNAAFNRALSDALSAKQYIGEKAGTLLFVDSTDGWREVLDTLIVDRLPIATPRMLYLANRDHFANNNHVSAPMPLPDGFSLHFIDESLKAEVQSELPGDVKNVLELRANSAEPDQAAFGYVALRGRECVSWSMVDVIVGTHGEIGLVTAPLFRRQGLGMAVSGATIRYGLAHGLDSIHWDVVSHNTASVQMAKKHGLQFSLSYDQNLLIFNEMSYVGNLAYHHLDNDRFQDGLDVCETLIDLENGRKFAHFLSGAAWAGLGEKEKAFQQLNQALEHGWDDLTDIQNISSLKILHGTAEWEGILARVKGNIQKGK
ncbi:MAG: GNAT family N-acetyltransferase [Chloroflexota bacterium]